MQVVSPEELAAAGGMAVSIGAYDGVHLGHRHLLGVLRAEAERRGVPAGVVTFDRHPASVVRPDSAPLLLTDTEQKLELLAACGVDTTVVVRFDDARANESAEDFVEEVLVGACRARAVVVGRDFHFGHGRKGDVALLAELGATGGFDAIAVGLRGGPGVDAPVSSTRIRRMVHDGDVAGAAALLGRPHEVRGTVVRGDRRGATLGVPTANLGLPEGLAVPKVGIYAGRLRRADGSSHVAAVSVGLRPTFYDTSGEGGRVPPLVEAHVLDFDDDLYDEHVGVAFLERLRDERRFEHVDDLVAQMREDVAAVRALARGETC